jgi:hypothetical protein
MTQLGIFDARARRDSGIAAAESGALEEFKREAFAAVVAYLQTHPTLHVDDLAPHLPSLPGDRRALGPVFLRAQRAGLMEKTDHYRPSVASNMTAKVIWRSLVYRAAVPGTEAGR